jgi:hypothetical protein
MEKETQTHNLAAWGLEVNADGLWYMPLAEYIHQLGAVSPEDIRRRYTGEDVEHKKEDP